MTTKTIEVHGHDYECTAADPFTCPDDHWGWPQEAPSLEEAIEWARDDDSPASRVVEIDEDGTETVVWKQLAWKPLWED